jgi:GH35 family endo-1,4-beta-xylanase
MQGMPAWLQTEDMNRLSALLEQHVRDLVRRYKNSIDIWDVVNEPVHRKEWAMIDRGYIGKAFRWAHEENPDAVLVINEFGALANPEDADAYLTLIEQLKAGSVPIGAVGLQAHTSGKRFQPVHMEAVFRRVQALGYPVHITAFDVPIEAGPKGRKQGEQWTPEAQGQYYGDFFSRCFADPAVEAITIWGHYRTWSKGAALYDDKLQPKPNWRVLDYLLNHAWRTDVTVTTSADGRASFRGFLGEYHAVWPSGKAHFRIDAQTERVALRAE